MAPRRKPIDRLTKRGLQSRERRIRHEMSSDDEEDIAWPDQEVDEESIQQQQQQRAESHLESSDYSNQTSESGSDLDSEEDTESTNGRLFSGSPYDREEAIVDLLMLSHRFALSHACVGSILRYLAKYLPAGNCMPRSKWIMDKDILNPESAYNCYRYCSKHGRYLGPELDQRIQNCRACESDGFVGTAVDSENLTSRFYVANLEHSIRSALSEESVTKWFDRHPGCGHLTMQDGTEFYNGDIQPGDISLSMFVDGAPVHNVSRTNSMVIVRVIINNLPFKMRQNYSFVIAISVTDKSIPPDVLWRPIVRQLLDLSANGMLVIGQTRKVFLRFIEADSPARSDTSGLSRYNKRDGPCTTCEIISSPGNPPSTACFPYRDQPARLRTHESILDHYLELRKRLMNATTPTAIKSIKAAGVRGVKRLSELQRLGKNHLDFGTGFPHDIMHIVQGFVKNFLHILIEVPIDQMPYGKSRLLITDPSVQPGQPAHRKYHDRRSRLITAAGVTAIDALNRTILKPSNLCRWPRGSIASFQEWKSSETLMCVIYLFLFVCGENHLLKAHIDSEIRHVMRTVTGALVLLLTDWYPVDPVMSAERVMDDREEAATLMINEFIHLSSNYFGKESIGWNWHQLLHLPLCYRRWGPLINFANYANEDFFRVIKRFQCGKINVDKEVVRKLDMWQTVRFLDSFRPAPFKQRISGSGRSLKESHLSEELQLFVINTIAAGQPREVTDIRVFEYAVLQSGEKVDALSWGRHLKRPITNSYWVTSKGPLKIFEVHGIIRMSYSVGDNDIFYVGRRRIDVQQNFVWQSTTNPHNILTLNFFEHFCPSETVHCEPAFCCTEDLCRQLLMVKESRKTSLRWIPILFQMSRD